MDEQYGNMRAALEDLSRSKGDLFAVLDTINIWSDSKARDARLEVVRRVREEWEKSQAILNMLDALEREDQPNQAP